MNIKKQVEEDIWSWIINYIEVNNKFYDYKFPVCPFAKSARLKGIVDVIAYDSGNVKQFIENQALSLPGDDQYGIRILVLPPRKKWTWGLIEYIEDLNKQLIPQDYFIQYGEALTTSSRYTGLFNNGNYFIVLINQLSGVMDGHKALLNTDFYKKWSSEHYNTVVTRRQELYDKYHNK